VNARRCRRLALAVVTTLVLVPASAYAQLAPGSAIRYQGRLTDGGAPATGSHDLRFTLFDATIDSAGDVGKYTSITIGADGLGLISYFDSTNGELKVARCVNAFCSPALFAVRRR
jgi:hypothetical protein